MNNKENKSNKLEPIQNRPKNKLDEDQQQITRLTLINSEIKQKIELYLKKNLHLVTENNTLKHNLDKAATANQKLEQICKRLNVDTEKELEGTFIKSNTQKSQEVQILQAELQKKDELIYSLRKEIQQGQLTYEIQITAEKSEILALKKRLTEAEMRLNEALKNAEFVKHYKAEIQRLKEQNKKIHELEDYKNKYQLLIIQKSARPIHTERIVHNTNKNHQQEVHDKKTKVIIADYQFEIKKLNEDLATFKILTELEKSKTAKQFETKVNIVKKQLEQENLNWINRFDIRDKQFHTELEKIRKQLYEEKERKLESVAGEMKRFKIDLEKDREAAIYQLKKSYDQKIDKLKSDNEKGVIELKESYEKKLKELKEKNDFLWLKREKQFDLVVVSIQSEKKSEQNMHNTTRQQLKQIREKLFEENHRLRKQIEVLKSNIYQLTKQKKELMLNLEQRETKIKENQQNFRQTLQNSENRHAEQKNNLKESMRNKIIQILETQIQKTEEFDTNIRVLQYKQLQQVELYSNQIEQIKSCFEERPSRPEDLQTIRQLEEKLWKKQNDFEMICQQLKWHRLELENKEETYNKIFANGGANLNLNQIKFPIDKHRPSLIKQFKFRKIGKSMIKEPKLGSGKNIPISSKLL